MNWNIEVDYWVIELDKTNSEKDRGVSDLLMVQGTNKQNGISVQLVSKAWTVALI
jgi:hypothetical protein